MMGRFLKVDDVMELTGYRRNASYALMRKLNEELDAAGRITFPGRVDAEYFMRRVFGKGESDE